MDWPTTEGVGKLRFRRNMEKSEKWAGQPGGRSGEFEEIWRNGRNGLADQGGGQEMEYSRKYGEIGEIE